jgi:thiamine monophosphate synthase
VKVHDELFSPGMGDRVWLGVAGEKQRIVLTQDSRIRYHRSTTVELLAAGVRAFALVGRNLTGKEMGSIFVKALPEIKALCQTKSAPFIAHVYSDGRVLLKAGSRGGKIHR